MNATASIVVSVLIASAAAVGITVALQPNETATDSLDIGVLKESLQGMQEANKLLAGRIEELAMRSAAAAAANNEGRTAVPVVTSEQVAAAVEAYLSTRSGTPLGGADGGAANATHAAFELKRDLENLLGTSFFQDDEAWKRAFAAGKMEEVIAEIEALANANPNDPQAQMNLAHAYIAYLQMDSSKRNLSMKADKQFDKVLDLDENHWEARFTKAVSYTFWPPFLGKGEDAITQFETLVQQQESRPVQAHEYQTYLYLGNMLAERDPKRAREIWQKGMMRHPNNAELREKLGNN